MKIFIPLYLVNSGYNTFFAGSFITVIELIHILLRPAGGIVGDKSGYYPSIIFGLLILGLSMFFVSLSFDKTILIICGIIILFVFFYVLFTAESDDDDSGPW